LANLNFPANPVNGQIYDSYQYSSAKAVWQSVVEYASGMPAGAVVSWAGASAPSNWLMCDGTVYNISQYPSLFAAIGSNYGGNGTTTFAVPDLRGRVPAGLNAQTFTTTMTIAAPGVLTTASAHGLARNHRVYLSTTGALPTGLTANTLYYVASAPTTTTLTLSATLGGAAITTSGTQSGTHTLTVAEFGTLGRSGGATTHTLNINEIPSHSHPFTYNGGEYSSFPYAAAMDTAGGLRFGVSSQESYGAIGIASRGADDQFNILQPYLTLNYIIKATSAESMGVATAVNTTNFLHNSDFSVWQRGTSGFTTLGGYCADRWFAGASAGTMSVSRSTDVPSNLPYSLSMAGTSTTTAYIQQKIESVDAIKLAGQFVTFSIWAKSTVGTLPLMFRTYTTATADTWTTPVTDQTFTLDPGMSIGSWTRYSVTFTIPSTANKGYGVRVYRDGTTTSTTTLYAGAQLEISPRMTDFHTNSGSYQAELEVCRRYYFQGESIMSAALDSAYATSWASTSFKTEMRASPTVVATAASMPGHHTIIPNLIDKNTNSVAFGWNNGAQRDGSRAYVTYTATADL